MSAEIIMALAYVTALFIGAFLFRVFFRRRLKERYLKREQDRHIAGRRHMGKPQQPKDRPDKEESSL